MDDERTIARLRSRRRSIMLRRDVDNVLPATRPAALSIVADPTIPPSDIAMLDKLHPSWRCEVRELLEELTLSDDALDRVLALEALEGFDAWETEQ